MTEHQRQRLLRHWMQVGVTAGSSSKTPEARGRRWEWQEKVSPCPQQVSRLKGKDGGQTPSKDHTATQGPSLVWSHAWDLNTNHCDSNTRQPFWLTWPYIQAFLYLQMGRIKPLTPTHANLSSGKSNKGSYTQCFFLFSHSTCLLQHDTQK